MARAPSRTRPAHAGTESSIPLSSTRESSANPALPVEKLRAAGAQTEYFDLHLNQRVGTPSAPADPSTIVAKANKFYDYAAQSMDCSNPVVAEGPTRL